MKTIKIFTLGCKANQYDSQLIREKFLKSGFRESGNGSKADLYLINTCTVTQRADRESYSLIRRVCKENPKARVIVTGCLTELDAEGIRQAGKKVTIIKNSAKVQIAPAQLKRISSFAGHTRAFLKIQDGCDNFCAYCKVPLVRGKPRSKKQKEILQEARGLVINGFQEIVLTGICLGKYGRDLEPKSNPERVIRELENISGLLRIRLSSIEAADITDALIDKMCTSEKLCRHLHIPIQSGDNQILHLMRRRYSAQDYACLIRKIKTKIPGVAITTDVLVGFPGESAENFLNTIKLVKRISPLKIHIFPYSDRLGTAAAKFPNKTAPAIIKARVEQFKKIAAACSLKYKQRFLNKTLPVLIESRQKKASGYWQGHTDNYLMVAVRSGANLKNKLIKVRLQKIKKDYILGKRV